MNKISATMIVLFMAGMTFMQGQDQCHYQRHGYHTAIENYRYEIHYGKPYGHPHRVASAHARRPDRRDVSRMNQLFVELDKTKRRAWRDGVINRNEARKIRRIEWRIQEIKEKYSRPRAARAQRYRGRSCG